MSKRLNMVVSDRTKDMIDDLVERSDSQNMTEMIRRALSLYDTLSKDIDEGAELVLRKPDNTGAIREQVLRII